MRVLHCRSKINVDGIKNNKWKRSFLTILLGNLLLGNRKNQNFYQYGVPIKESLLCLVRVFLAETPKSASFTSPSIVRSTLPAFRSRCITLLKITLHAVHLVLICSNYNHYHSRTLLMSLNYQTDFTGARLGEIKNTIVSFGGNNNTFSHNLEMMVFDRMP